MSSKDSKTRFDSPMLTHERETVSWGSSSGERGGIVKSRDIAQEALRSCCTMRISACSSGLEWVSSTGGDSGCDFVELELHGLGICRPAARELRQFDVRGNRTEQIGRWAR